MSLVSSFWNNSKGRCYCYITYLPSVRHNSNLLVCHQSIENYIQHRMTAGNAGVIRVEEQMSTDMDGETVLGAGPASSTRRTTTRRRTGSNRRMACHGSSANPCVQVQPLYVSSCAVRVAAAMAAELGLGVKERTGRGRDRKAGSPIQASCLVGPWQQGKRRSWLKASWDLFYE